jgi:predicted dinucleotide-binding enzyme
MRIGVIGAGQEGSALAGLFVHAGHDVAIANSGHPDTLDPIADELGHHCHPVSGAEAVRFGDVVVLAIPFGHYRELSSAAVAGKTVVDATNYLPDVDGHVAALDDDSTSSSELIQNWLSDAVVVKAFNAMRSEHLRQYGHEDGANRRYGLAVAGDSAAAKWRVFDLIEQLGYEPVDAGGLAQGGRKLQPGTPIYTADLWSEDLRHEIGDPAA